MTDERDAALKLVELCNQIIVAYPCVNRSEGKFCEHGCMTEKLTDAVREYLAMEAS